MVETLEQRFGREEPQSRGGELERERQTVQPLADGRDGFGVLVRQLEGASVSAARARTPSNATGRAGARAARARYSRSAAIRSGVLLVVTIRSAGQRAIRRDTSGAADDDLLEVVEEQERFLVADQRGEALAERALFGLLDVQRVSNGAG